MTPDTQETHVTAAAPEDEKPAVSLYESLCEEYEIRKAEFDNELAGAADTIALLMSVVRGFMGHIGWPQKRWEFAPHGRAERRKGAFGDRFWISTKTSIACTVALKMRSERVNVDVLCSADDTKSPERSIVFAGQLLKINQKDPSSVIAGYDRMLALLKTRLISAARESKT